MPYYDECGLKLHCMTKVAGQAMKTCVRHAMGLTFVSDFDILHNTCCQYFLVLLNLRLISDLQNLSMDFYFRADLKKYYRDCYSLSS